MPDDSVVSRVVVGYQYQGAARLPGRWDSRRYRCAPFGRQQSSHPLISTTDLQLVGHGHCGAQQAPGQTRDSAGDDRGKQMGEMGGSPRGLGTKPGDRSIGRADVVAEAPGDPLGRTVLAWCAGASIKTRQLLDISAQA